MSYLTKLKEMAAKVRKIFPAGTLTGLPPEWEYPQTIVVQGHTMPASRCYPLRALPDGRRPVVTSKFKTRNPERPNHNGCDLFYKYELGKDPAMKNGDGGRTGKWWIPDNTYAVAQADGEIEIAGNSRTGYRLWVRHDGGLATGGFHFTKLMVATGDLVTEGQKLAVVGDNPIDNDARHLHTELIKGKLGSYPSGLLDPELFWIGAKLLPSE